MCTNGDKWFGTRLKTHHPACVHSHTGLTTLQRQNSSLFSIRTAVVQTIVQPIVASSTLKCLLSFSFWCTSAGGGSVIPLWWVPRDAVDGGLALQLVARMAGEAQRLSGLVEGLFGALHAGGGCARVPARLVLLRCEMEVRHTEVLLGIILSRVLGFLRAASSSLFLLSPPLNWGLMGYGLKWNLNTDWKCFLLKVCQMDERSGCSARLAFTFLTSTKNSPNDVLMCVWHRGWLTDTLGQPLAPLGRGRVSVVAGEHVVAGQDVAFVTDELHRGADGEAAAREHPVTVLHISRVRTRHNWLRKEKKIRWYQCHDAMKGNIVFILLFKDKNGSWWLIHL